LAKVRQEEERNQAIDEQSQRTGPPERRKPHITRETQRGKSRHARGTAEKNHSGKLPLSGLNIMKAFK
jgi:hypothetical protein